MAARDQAAKDLRALELRRAGVPLPEIMKQVGFRTAKTCSEAIQRAMVAQGVVTDPLAVRLAELDRLDRLQAAVWVKAARGDVNAIDRVLKLAEMRLRIAGIADAGLTPLTAAYDRTVDALALEGDVDAAVVAFGRRYCEQVDAASALGDPLAVTKALHLMPHVVNVLRELGATPAARGEIVAAARGGAAAPSGEEGVPNDLDAFKARKGGHSAGRA